MLFAINFVEPALRRLLLITAGAALWLSIPGCSSGGGGGGNATPGGVPYEGNTSPAVITTTNAGKLVGNIVGSSAASDVIFTASVLPSSPYGVRESFSETGLAHRLSTYFNDMVKLVEKPLAGKAVAAVMPVDEITPCENGGSAHITGSLNDNGTGTLTVTYTGCRTGDETLDGVVTMRIDAFDLYYLVPTDVTFSFAVVTLTTPTSSQSLSGSLRDQLNIPANTETLTINTVTRDNISSASIKAENLVTVAVFDNIFSPASYTETISGRVYDSVHGYVDVITLTPIGFGSLNQFFPNSGQILLTGAAGATIRVSALSAVLAKLELDLDGNAAYETTAILKWTDLGGAVGADLGDTDLDGMHNSWETVYGLNPLLPDGGGDKDGDGFTNLQEYQGGTDPGNAASVPLSADLVIGISGPPNPVTPGSAIAYTVAVVNWGPAIASDVVLTYVLPTGITLNTVQPGVGSCSGTATVTCSLGGLPVGTVVYINLSVTASAQGLYSNTVTVASITPEANAANNSATAMAVAGNPASLIQGLIDAAVPGDTVNVAPGVYVGSIDFKGKNVNLVSVSGPAATILHGNNGKAVRMGPGGAIVGFTITGAVASFGAGIEVSGSGSVISGNTFDGNVESSGGYGAAIGGNSASPAIERNIFRNNSCDSQSLSGVVTFVNSSSPTIVNNIFENNQCRGLNLTLPEGNTPRVINNTFVGNPVAIRINRNVTQVTQIYRNNILFQNGTGVEASGGTDSYNPVWQNNLVFGNTTNYQGIADQTGLNMNISVTPQFVGTANYRLLGTSPAIDAGSALDAPSIDFDGTARPLDGNGDALPAVDIGAFEYSPT